MIAIECYRFRRFLFLREERVACYYLGTDYTDFTVLRD